MTAAFAKACNIYYYMSDDNRVSSHIKSLAAVDIVNFCDILFLHLIVFGKGTILELRECYKNFIDLYDVDKIPKILKNKGIIRSFEEIMGICYENFYHNANLKRLLENVKQNALKIETEKNEGKL